MSTEEKEVSTGRRPRGLHEDTRREIVRVAGELFAERGFDGVSIRDIGAAVGVLKGSLYHYISSKEELLYEIIAVGHQGLLENLRICAELRGSPLERLSAFTYNHITLNAEESRYARGIVFLRDSHHLPEAKRAEIHRDRAAYEEFLRNLIDDGQREWQICPELNPRLCSLGILGVLNGFQRWFRPSGPTTPDQIGREFAGFVVSAVACDPTTHRPGHRFAFVDAMAPQLETLTSVHHHTEPPSSSDPADN